MNAKTTRRPAYGAPFVVAALTALLSVWLFPPALAQQTYDIVLRDGRVLDPESGLDAVRHVGIAGKTIAALSTQPLRGKIEIDAAGLVVAPGFIDLHSHGQTPENYRYKAMDGVTTALELEVGVSPVSDWYASRKGRSIINFGASSGHIPARMAVMKDTGGLLPRDAAMNRPATPKEQKEIEAAHARGLDVTTEAYPYTASMTEIASAAYDGWEKQGPEYFSRLLWPVTGERLTRESFERYRKQGGFVIQFGNSEEMVRAAVSHAAVMIASDGIIEGGKGHPRGAGTYARVLGKYVREEGALTLMDAVRKSSLMPAQRLERMSPPMRQKGRLKVGA